jgi:amino acid adenylation domain-containing protein
MQQPNSEFSEIELSSTAPSTKPQQEIWMAIELGGDEASLAYNECESLEILGPVDPELLARSWNLLAERHESMRICFTPDGQTLCIEKRPRVEMSILDWTRDSEARKREKRDALLDEEVSTPFDLVSRPAYRAAWVDYGDGKSEFFMTGHHIVCDGYSTGVLMTELSGIYTALSRGEEPSLPPAPSFSQYALQTKESLNAAEATEAEKYWLGALGVSPETLDLPTDLPRPAQRSFAARREDVLIPRELLDAFRAAAIKMGVSLTAAFQAAFNTFLFRLTGQTEFVLGIPAAGQTLPGFQGLVGQCVNTLPIPVRLNPDKPFSEYVRDVKIAILDGVENQVLSFGGLLQKLKLPRDPSRIPLIPILLNLDPPVKLGKLGTAEIEIHFHPRKFEAFEIFFNGTETEKGLILEATYNTALFQRGSIKRWVDDLQKLLREVLNNPSRPLKEYSVLSTDSEALLREWNATERELPLDATALAMFEAQAAKTPNALAVRDAKASLTYHDLDSRANFLAAKLKEYGVAAGDLIGVCVERGVQTPAVLIAAWKAGAAYVPLDPDFPEERLDFILRDSGVKVLITETSLIGVLKSDGVQRLLVDESPGMADVRPGREIGPRDLAYILYTSGSTGKPKGVQIEQRSLANFLMSMTRDLSIEKRDILVAVTTLSFDISGLELYLPLVNGAQTVIAAREDAIDGNRLSRLMTTCAATMLQATPATWRLLVEADWKAPGGFKALCGGEALPQELCRKLAARVPELWNVYGPTETTIWSTLEKISSPDAPVSIGRPIGNTVLYVVDAELRPLPIGAAGELLIGGLGVARGYLKRPELDAEKFLPDPFSATEGARIYRTGDICRFGPDGRVYFQRRNDSQVKVRGFRIELGEIETAIAKFKGIVSAVAAVREYGPDDVRLMGYYIPEEGVSPDAVALREFLTSALPRYMVPQNLVCLDKFPMTPNGKIDRKALPSPSAEDAPASGRIVEASTQVQKELASIWSELLRVARISIKDSFFDLGGHSILAARMLSRIRESFGIDLPMRVVFQAQTIEDIALRIEAAQLSSVASADSHAVEQLDF